MTAIPVQAMLPNTSRLAAAVRETVNVVGQNHQPGDIEAGAISLTEVTDKLGVDKSSASRRVKYPLSYK